MQRREDAKARSSAQGFRHNRTKSYFDTIDFKIGSRHRDDDKYRLNPKNLY